MKKLFILMVAVIALLPLACSATQSLWAMNVGNEWSPSDKSYIIDPDSFGLSEAVYPTEGLRVLWDAAYVPSISTLYISGGSLIPHWASSSIALYQGSPEGLSFSSLSDVGMISKNWMAGIEYIDGNLYGICETASPIGDVIFTRIDNPGTPAQTVIQIGANIGATEYIGHPFALGKNGEGGLIASIGYSMYNIDIQTGNAVLLHTYSSNDFLGAIEGLTLFEDRLFGVITGGILYEIDRDTYNLIEVADLGNFVWTALVTVPEPSIILIYVLGVLLFFIRRCK